VDFAKTYTYTGDPKNIAEFLQSAKYFVPKRLSQEVFRSDSAATLNIDDEVFVNAKNKKGKVIGMQDNPLGTGKLAVIQFTDGTEFTEGAVFASGGIYALDRIQAIMKRAGVE
jgi:hypothetical protein